MGSFRLAASIILAASTVALAQPNPKVQTAGELVKQAIAKSQSGDHQAAIELYLAAYNLVPQPILLSNIGSEYQQSNKPVESLKYFCKYLDADPTGTNSTYATAQAKVLQIQLGNEVNDKDVCKPLPKKAEPPPPPPPPPDEGKKAEPESPPPPPPAAPENDPGKTTRMTGVALAAVGGAALLVGGYYAYKGYSLSSQISNHPMGQPWPTQIDGVPIDNDQWNTVGHTYNTRAWTFSIVGAVVAGAGVLVYTMGNKKHNDERAVLVPVASPEGVGLSFVGGF